MGSSKDKYFDQLVDAGLDKAWVTALCNWFSLGELESFCKFACDEGLMVSDEEEEEEEEEEEDDGLIPVDVCETCRDRLVDAMNDGHDVNGEGEEPIKDLDESLIMQLEGRSEHRIDCYCCGYTGWAGKYYTIRIKSEGLDPMTLAEFHAEADEAWRRMTEEMVETWDAPLPTEGD